METPAKRPRRKVISYRDLDRPTDGPDLSFLTGSLLKEVRTAALEAKSKKAEGGLKTGEGEPKKAQEGKKTEERPRLSSEAVSQLEKEFESDDDIEESSETTTEGTDASVIPDTEESSLLDEETGEVKEEHSTEDGVVKMEY